MGNYAGMAKALLEGIDNAITDKREREREKLGDDLIRERIAKLAQDRQFAKTQQDNISITDSLANQLLTGQINEDHNFVSAGGRVFPNPMKSRTEGGKPIMTGRDLVRSKLGLDNKKWVPTTREEAIDFEKEKNRAKGGFADATGLDQTQQVKARTLARKLWGVRGAKDGLPEIYALMKQGKTIDEIEDEIRFGGQSSQFTGAVRNAVQSILINENSAKSQNAMDYIDDLYSSGDTEEAKNQIKRLARKQAGIDQSKTLTGKERTIKLLDEIQDELTTLENNGVSTNIFTGTLEDMNAKIGRVNNPEMRKVATKIKTAIQNYRRSMTGVAFGQPENEEYKILFPSISKTANFNSANISGLKEVLQGDLENFYSLSMGEGAYKELFGDNGTTQEVPDWAKGKEKAYKTMRQKYTDEEIKYALSL